MPEANPTAVIAECIEKCKATDDQDLIADFITETLGLLQIDNTEEDAFNMLGSAIVDTVADDEAHTATLLEVWTELDEQRKLAQAERTGRCTASAGPAPQARAAIVPLAVSQSSRSHPRAY